MFLPNVKKSLKALYRFFVSLQKERDDQTRFLSLAWVGSWLYPSFIFSWNGYRWQDYKKFFDVMKKYHEDESFNMPRRFTVAQLQRLTVGVPGDTAECGVYYGADSELILLTNVGTNKTHHIFDSFEGLSEPNTVDRASTHWTQGDMAVSLGEVQKNLKDFSSVQYYQGWIPLRFSEVENKRFSFVHIDVDLEQPTKDSFEFFYPRLSPGGIIVCDDYGFITCPGATSSIDEFLKDKPEKMISLANGGGFIIKGTTTQEEFLT